MAAKARTQTKKRGRGRPSKLTPERQALICEAIRDGCSIEAAAAAGDVDHSTYWRWMERGRKATTGRHREFRKEVQRARADGERRLVKRVETDQNWRGPAWLLERRWRDDYGRKLQETRRAEVELKKLEAEADLAVAKAELARKTSKYLGQGVGIVRGDRLVAGIGLGDLAELTPTPLPGADE